MEGKRLGFMIIAIITIIIGTMIIVSYVYIVKWDRARYKVVFIELYLASLEHDDIFV